MTILNWLNVMCAIFGALAYLRTGSGYALVVFAINFLAVVLR